MIRKILLDTHAFLWLISNDPKLKKIWAALVENESNEIFLSIASLWEIAIKTSIGKLDLPVPFEELVRHNIGEHGLILLPITADHVIQLKRLPFHHHDPFDRIIIAQSIVENLEVMSVDGDFSLYGIKVIS